MTDERVAPVVRGPGQVTPIPLGPGVTGSELLGDEHGCRRLHQRRLRFAGGSAVGRSAVGRSAVGRSAVGRSALDGTVLDGTADGRGECWYVFSGSGDLDTGVSKTVVLRAGTAVWIKGSLRYQCRARPGQDLEVLVVTVRARTDGDDTGPALRVATLDACEPERTGDREFRVLLSSGLAITQFAGLIPPGRAPAHQHTYDEIVHVLAGQGVVHLSGSRAEIGPGTSVYLPPYQPHCLENTGSGLLEVLGVFYPAGSPAAKQGARNA
jgi:mannose-6-phosphate isomerase-like protein (cupin superfamily)